MAHLFIVQATSVLAMLFGFLALFFVGKAYRHFSPGEIKQTVSLMLATILLIVPAMLFMVIYHVWDWEMAQNLWHILIGFALIGNMLASLYLVKVSRKFA